MSNKKSKILYISTVAIGSEISLLKISDSIELPETFLALSSWKLLGDFKYFTELRDDQSGTFPVDVFIGRYSLLSGESLIHIFDLPYIQFSSDFTFISKGEILWLVDNYIWNNNTGTTDLILLSNSFNLKFSSHLPGFYLSKANILNLSKDTISISSRFFENNLTHGSPLGLKVSRMPIGPQIMELSSFFEKRNNKQLDTGIHQSFIDSIGNIMISGTINPKYHGNTFEGTFDNKLYLACLDKEPKLVADSSFSIDKHFMHLNGIMPTSRSYLLLFGTAYTYRSDNPNNDAFLLMMNTPCSSKEITGMSLANNETTEIYLSPNPVNDFLQIALPNVSSGRFSLFDMQGRLVYCQRFTEKLRVSTVDMPAGIYIYRIRDDKNRTQHGKWVKQ